jgi:hypothetical protein
MVSAWADENKPTAATIKRWRLDIADLLHPLKDTA